MKRILIFPILLLVALGTNSSLLNYMYLLSIALYIAYKARYSSFQHHLQYRIIIGITIYIFFLLWGITNPDFHIDMKFHIYWIFVFIFFEQVLKNLDDSKRLISFIYWISLIVSFIYFILYFDKELELLPNIYASDVKAQGYGYRIEGPSVLFLFLLPFVHNTLKRPIDLKYLILSIIAFFAILLNGSFQYLIIFIGIHIINYFKFTTSNVIKAVLFLSISFLIFKALVLPRLHPNFIDKLNYLKHPWEYPTVKTRLYDLNYMLDKTTNTWQEILFGSGVGIKSVVYRENKISPSLSRDRVFLEIDNGFFYIYHRTGLIGLFIFIFIQVYLVYSIKDKKTISLYLFFFLIINLFSIHYFTDSLTAIIVATIVYARKNDSYTIIFSSSYK